MKKLIVLLLALQSLNMWAMDATMYHWKSHVAYGTISCVADAGDKVYGLAGGSLVVIDKKTEEIIGYAKQDGLNGSDIAQIAYDSSSKTLIIAYSDGLIDLMHNGTFIAMTDLQQKSMTISKQTNKIVVNNGQAYFCMPFGILLVDVANRLIKDTYYIGVQGSDVNVMDLAISQDSIFAISSNALYSIGKNDNLMDYTYWHCSEQTASDSVYRAIAVWEDDLYLVANTNLFKRQNNKWKKQAGIASEGLRISDNRLFILTQKEGIYSLKTDGTIQTEASSYYALDIAANGTTYWLGTASEGIVKQTPSSTQSYVVSGPLVNIPYRLKIAGSRLYMVIGQRWADENPKRDAYVMIYDIEKETWYNIAGEDVDKQTGYHIFDLMNVAVDPQDAEHFYVTSYGTGVLEFQGLQLVNRYTYGNSPLETAAPGTYEQNYVRTDGAIFDAEGNLWFLNPGGENLVHVASPAQLASSRQSGTGSWFKMPLNYASGVYTPIYTPDPLIIDNKNSHWKWIPSVRVSTGLALLDDKGTPQYAGDDEAYFRNTFTDQDGKEVKPTYIYALAQDKEGTLWLAPENGVITIPSSIDFKTSNRCERIKIARNDGTGLADYLLETEQINAIAVDGANRKWFGTQSSGVYLISADGEQTIEHFTVDNSPLLSNTISSLAIDPKTGRVFIGSDKGLMSYQGDAAMPFDDYSSAYAYPNPVYPDYEGVITITGLMDETSVHITDQAGNLVCQTRSNGGTAIWDGKTADGQKVSSGVYNVFCNESNNQHTLVKILILH